MRARDQARGRTQGRERRVLPGGDTVNGNPSVCAVFGGARPWAKLASHACGVHGTKHVHVGRPNGASGSQVLHCKQRKLFRVMPRTMPCPPHPSCALSPSPPPQATFEDCFAKQYAIIHRLETNKLRNVAKLFAHLLANDAISWGVLQCIRLTEDDTTSSSRIFIKYLFQVRRGRGGQGSRYSGRGGVDPGGGGGGAGGRQAARPEDHRSRCYPWFFFAGSSKHEQQKQHTCRHIGSSPVALTHLVLCAVLCCVAQELSEYLGLVKLNERLAEPSLQEYFTGIFPQDTMQNMRFSINFFTSIGLGGITDRQRERYKEVCVQGGGGALFSPRGGGG